MVRIPVSVSDFNVKAVIFLLLLGWGLFALATGLFFLLRHQAGKLDARDLLEWQRKWEERRGHRPIRDFANIYLEGAGRISFVNRLVGVVILAIPFLIVVAWFGLPARYLVALFALEIGFLVPSYLGAKMVSRGLVLVGEKILVLASDLPDRDATGQGRGG